MLKAKHEIEKVLTAFAEQLAELGAGNLAILVCGGAALNVLGYVSRTTQDIDVVAIAEENQDGAITLRKPTAFEPAVIQAAEKVQRDFALVDHWLNLGPAAVMDLGLPKGLLERVETRKYGRCLTVHYLSRYDQIHFKLYAVADQAAGKHLDDLLALKPTDAEIEAAARWCLTQDISIPFRTILKDCLETIGCSNVAGKL
jgi:hypothetical protein